MTQIKIAPSFLTADLARLADAGGAGGGAGPAPPVPQRTRSLGCRAGVCLSPPTPVSAIEGVLGQVDQVMVMGVNPGWGGQALIPETLPKIAQVRALLEKRGLSP